MFTKIKNAYLLFYERKGYYNIQLIKELNSELKDKPVFYISLILLGFK